MNVVNKILFGIFCKILSDKIELDKMAGQNLQSKLLFTAWKIVFGSWGFGPIDKARNNTRVSSRFRGDKIKCTSVLTLAEVCK